MHTDQSLKNTEEDLTVGKMSRTAGQSMSKINDQSEVVIAQNLCHEDVRVGSAGEIASMNSNDTA